MNTTARTFASSLALVSGFTALVACGVPSGESASSSASAIVGGDKEAGADAAGYVIVATAGVDGKRVESRCAGTAVAKSVVLTAAHCIPVGESEIVFGLGKVDPKGTFRPVRSVLIHPRYAGTPEKPGAHDLAALILAEPLDVVAAEIGTTPKVDDKGIVVGYGVVTKDYDGTKEFEVSADKKSATMRVDDVDKGLFLATGLDGAGCGGDSGGPFFAADKKTLLGVQSYGQRPCTSTSWNVFTDLASESTFTKFTFQCAAFTNPDFCWQGARIWFFPVVEDGGTAVTPVTPVPIVPPATPGVPVPIPPSVPVTPLPPGTQVPPVLPPTPFPAPDAG
ncbi:MAG: trypsin-like serine protease [Polyangiaceae bacterium]